MEYEIKYENLQELPNNTSLFPIQDKNGVVVGYAVTSAIDSFAILGSSLNESSVGKEFNALKNDLESFCKVYYHEASN